MNYTKLYVVDIMPEKGYTESEARAYLQGVKDSGAEAMYEALKEIGLNIAVNYDDDDKPIFLIDKAYLDRVRAIVAEAEGKDD